MVRKFQVGIRIVMFALFVCQNAGSDSLPKASQWIPQDAVITFEMSKPADLFHLLLGPRIEKAVTTAPEYQALANEQGFKELQGVIRYLETTLSTDWKTAVKTLLGKGGTFSLLPENKILLTTDSEDSKLLSQLHEILYGFAKNEAENQGNYDRVKSKEYKGVTGYTFGQDEAHCIIDNRFMFTNKSNVLKQIIDNRSNSELKSLSTLENYQCAQSTINPEASLKGFLRLDILNQFTGINKVLTKNLNPLAALLLAGLPDSLSVSNWLSAGLHVGEEHLSLLANIDGKLDTSDPLSFIGSNGCAGGVLPIIQVPNQIASFSFYRDLYQFYSAKDDLFPERTSGLIFFENMMGIFFTGRDLTEEVWKEVKPEIRFVVSEQRYDPSIGAPAVQLPSFAVIFKLFNPEKFGLIAEEAWQKAIGLVNFTRGQEALPGLLIDRPVYKDIKMTSTYFSSMEEDDKSKLETRFNFRPTLARIEDNLILSSTDQLAEDIIDSVLVGTVAPLEKIPGTHSLVQINADRLASILTSNRETIVRNDMIEKGKTKEQAEAGQEILHRILSYLNQATLQVGMEDNIAQAALKLSLNLPAVE